MAFGNQVAAKPQHFVDQSVVLIAAGNDDRIDPPVDILDGEPQTEDSLQGETPVGPQGRPSSDDAPPIPAPASWRPET
jgi:hypothetical protein